MPHGGYGLAHERVYVIKFGLRASTKLDNMVTAVAVSLTVRYWQSALSAGSPDRAVYLSRPEVKAPDASWHFRQPELTSSH